jgi:hypothetical protein
MREAEKLDDEMQKKHGWFLTAVTFCDNVISTPSSVPHALSFHTSEKPGRDRGCDPAFGGVVTGSSGSVRQCFARSCRRGGNADPDPVPDRTAAALRRAELFP